MFKSNSEPWVSPIRASRSGSSYPASRRSHRVNTLLHGTDRGVEVTSAQKSSTLTVRRQSGVSQASANRTDTNRLVVVDIGGGIIAFTASANGARVLGSFARATNLGRCPLPHRDQPMLGRQLGLGVAIMAKVGSQGYRA